MEKERNEEQEQMIGGNIVYRIADPDVIQYPQDLKACQALRRSIFVEEQKIPIEIEMDGKDVFHEQDENHAESTTNHHHQKKDKDNGNNDTSQNKCITTNVIHLMVEVPIDHSRTPTLIGTGRLLLPFPISLPKMMKPCIRKNISYSSNKKNVDSFNEEEKGGGGECSILKDMEVEIPEVSTEESKQNDAGIIRNTSSLTAELGRIVVHSSWRGLGLGKQVIRQLENIVMTINRCVELKRRRSQYMYQPRIHRITLTPHAYLQTFYSKLGFTVSPMDSQGSNEKRNNPLIVVNEHCSLLPMEKCLLREQST